MGKIRGLRDSFSRDLIICLQKQPFSVRIWSLSRDFRFCFVILFIKSEEGIALTPFLIKETTFATICQK